MSMKLVSSGSYNVRASEMAHLQDRQPKTVNCVVHFLDETDETFEIDKRQKAQHLLDKVFDHLELVEKDYFGLQFIDMAPGEDGLVGPPYEFFFRVKFYVSDPSKLAEEYTRGQTPADAEFNFLERAKRLEMYGVDLHNARVRNDPVENLIGFNMVSYRSPSKRYRRTVGAVSRDAILEEKRFIDGYRQMSKSQTFSGRGSEHSHYGFNRREGANSHVRATLPHDYKSSRASWNDGTRSERSDE
nr:hypothetical protein BaRGS_034426 [Batillaria attramentaria]